MALFAVIRRRTERWAHGRTIEEQPDWRAHADYMDAGEADGFFLLAGPLEAFDEVLLIVRADSAEAVEARLAEDPWSKLRLLETVRIAEWTLRVGALPVPGAEG